MRLRAVPAAALALALAGAAILDEARPARTPAPLGAQVSVSGATLVCPIALAGPGPGYVDVANLGGSPASVRVTAVPDRGRPAVVRAVLGPGGIRRVGLRGKVASPAGAIVELAGGLVVASHSVSIGGPRGGRGVAPCKPAGGDTSVVLLGSTLRASTTLVLMNPGGGDAVVGVSFVVGDRVVRPERLRERVVRARRRLSVRIHDFVFDRGDVAAVVRMRTGRVVAEGLIAATTGIELLPAAAPSAAPAVILGSRDIGVVGLLSLGRDDSAIDTQLLEPGGGGRAPGAPVEAPVEQALHLPTPPGSGPAAYAVSVREGSPVALGARWRLKRPSGMDQVASVGADPARRLGGVASAPEGRGKLLILRLANPGGDPATVTVHALGAAPFVLTLAPGRVVSRVLGRTGTAAVEVTSDRPVLGSLEGIGVNPGAWAFAITLTPMPPAPRVAVAADPRAGVPAPLWRAPVRG